MSTCSSCGAQILWIRTLSGRPMPVDATPVQVMVHLGQGERDERGDMVPLYSSKRGYISHFATCPNASQHRKTAPAKAGVNGTPGEPAPGES